MAGGIAPIDFWGVFNAAANASAQKRAQEHQLAQADQQLAMQQQQADVQTQERADALAQRSKLAELLTTGKNLSPQEQAVAQANPGAFMDYQKQQAATQAQQQEQAQRREQATAELQGRLVDAVRANPNAAPMLQRIVEQKVANKEINPIELPMMSNAPTDGMTGPPTMPEQQARQTSQLDAMSLGSQVVAPKEPEKTADDIYRQVVNGTTLKPGTPEFQREYNRQLSIEQQQKLDRAKAAGGLTMRETGRRQAAISQGELVKGAAAEIRRLTNGNPDMLGSLLNKTRAWSADAFKAIGLPPGATAEDLANIQEQVRVNMELIKQNSVFRDAEGNVEADLSGALTGGNNLGASLDAIEKQVDRMQGVYAAPPPVVGGKGPPATAQPKPPKSARFELEKGHRNGTIDEATYQAGLAALKGKK